MKSNTSLEDKKALILDEEHLFCRRLSAAVIEKPTLSIWMILIPVFFVFYFWHYSRYTNARKEFSQNYLITRQRALDASFTALMRNQVIELAPLLEAEDVPLSSRPAYHDWLIVLTDHYLLLLQCKADSFQNMIREVYQSRKAYHSFQRRLTIVETGFTASIEPSVEEDDSEVKIIIEKIKTETQRLRQQELQEVYS